jgi:hypothetical protein
LLLSLLFLFRPSCKSVELLPLPSPEPIEITHIGLFLCLLRRLLRSLFDFVSHPQDRVSLATRHLSLDVFQLIDILVVLKVLHLDDYLFVCKVFPVFFQKVCVSSRLSQVVGYSESKRKKEEHRCFPAENKRSVKEFSVLLLQVPEVSSPTDPCHKPNAVSHLLLVEIAPVCLFQVDLPMVLENPRKKVFSVSLVKRELVPYYSELIKLFVMVFGVGS